MTAATAEAPRFPGPLGAPAAPVLHLRLDGYEGPLDLLLDLARSQNSTSAPSPLSRWWTSI